VKSFSNFSTVSESVKHRIIQLLQDVSQFNANDVLVNIDHSSLLPIIDFSSFKETQDYLPFKSIVSSAKKTEKEQGIFPLCISQGIIEWEYKQSAVRTPLFLSPVEIEIKKVDNTIRFSDEEEFSFINPFLINRLQREFEIKLPAEILNLEQLIEFLENNNFKNIQSNANYLGNFHHHRFEIIKELEELSNEVPNAAISNLLGDESKVESYQIKLNSNLLFPADTDQYAVFKTIEKEHTVIQGPPGTGKSQVLSNLLAKLLIDNKSALVVSEKRVALEVLQKKLGQFNLDHLCFIATSETISKDVLKSLKDSWTQLEKFDLKSTSNLQLSEQYIAQLQMQLDLLNQKELIGGISYFQFHELAKETDFESANFSSDLPSLDVWLEAKNNVHTFFNEGINSFISRISFGVIKQDSFKQFDQSINLWLNELNKLHVQFQLETWLDLQKAMKKAAICQSFDNPSFRRHQAILTPESKEQKKFLKLKKKFTQLQILQSNLDFEKSNWKVFPSLSETENLLNLSKETGFFGKLKFKKSWSNVSITSVNQAENNLHKWKQFLVNSEAISQVKIELCEIGIDDVHAELELIFQQIHFYTASDREEWMQIPTALQKIYASTNHALNQLYSQLKLNFNWDDETNIQLFLEGVKNNFGLILQYQNSINEMNESCVRNMKNYSTFDQMEAAVLKSNWTKFTAQFPVFSKFSPAELLNKCHTIISEQEKEAISTGQEIVLRQHKQFQYYHKILQTASTKLNSEEKALKATLKKGKAILVKEFAKTKNFPSLRELFASEARIWIQLFKPIWLSNPTQIAKCFPMQNHLFDVAIFDEASQIPLQNALGAIQRSKRIIVAGDHQQMGPSSFFKAQSEETIDLLHQSSFYWKNVGLKHHYRSEHPELLKFSNYHFYNNELITFPSFKQEKTPVIWHYSKEGIFDERKNEIEAKAVVLHIEKVIDSKEMIGIVAFSETQLAEIYTQLTPQTKEKLEIRLDSDTAFFKALENVQGEECDQLVISLGYGKNENGEFHMRFGPLNTKNGSKRLNVLLTRARKKIDFFSSVKGSDFKISSNEAIDLLRLYLLQLESSSNEVIPHQFPYSLSPSINGNSLAFDSIYAKIQDANELVTLVNVMENRGWKISF
jgi:hypothetical protein